MLILPCYIRYENKYLFLEAISKPKMSKIMSHRVINFGLKLKYN